MPQLLTFLSFVEDAVTRAAVIRLLCSFSGRYPFVALAAGHPVVTHGNGRLKEKALKLRDAACSGVASILVTDLDANHTPNDLGRNWFGVVCLSDLPNGFIFRVASREIEAWIMADREGFSKYLSVSPDNFPDDSESIIDPKRFLLNLIAAKCRKKRFRDMLPLKGQKIGINYNPVLVDFVENHWNIENATLHSSSLKRAIDRIRLFLESKS